ncbi:hypothetical protein IW262DRAFT_1296924 [Armillaria fumosa]|nr:hypothetical protein IW262DRAFT_1296924 [Armillaria fumosa]
MDPQPPVISQDEKNILFSVLDLNMNTMALEAFLHATQFVITWDFERSAFIKQGNNYNGVFMVLVDLSPWRRTYFLANGITGGISVLLVDMTIIWRCWVLWDRQWRVLFVPIGCVVIGTDVVLFKVPVMKILQTLSNIHKISGDNSKTGHFAGDIDWTLIYIFMTLATTLLCTLLIVYRIVWRAYVSLTFDIESEIPKPIAPTLLVARVSAHDNTSLRQEQMVAMWENHRPLVGCFGEECTNNSHLPDDEDQMVSGSSDKETG